MCTIKSTGPFYLSLILQCSCLQASLLIHALSRHDDKIKAIRILEPVSCTSFEAFSCMYSCLLPLIFNIFFLWFLIIFADIYWNRIFFYIWLFLLSFQISNSFILCFCLQLLFSVWSDSLIFFFFNSGKCLALTYTVSVDDYISRYIDKLDR